MASKKLPNSESTKAAETISSDAEFWFEQFLKHARIAFQERCLPLTGNPSHDEVQRATIEALVETLLESGASQESLIEAVGQMTLNREAEMPPWTALMNNRRVDLIDRDLQGTATLEETSRARQVDCRHAFGIGHGREHPNGWCKTIAREAVELEPAGKASLIFDYPPQRAERRHGPDGYRQYESFRPWLRDEFKFQCVYCLKRETWGQVTSEFELDHFEPQSINPARKLDYLNLVYACRRCNSTKNDRLIADPFLALNHGALLLRANSRLKPNTSEAKRIIRILDLNSPKMVKWRKLWESDR